MIADNIKNTVKYERISGRLKAAFAAIKAASPELEPGKYNVDGDNVFYMVQEIETKLPGAFRYENHRDYIDIQYVIEGEEEIRVAWEEAMTATDDYKPDVQHFDGAHPNFNALLLKNGDFTVLYPGEIHAPGIAPKGVSGKVRKIVAKVKVN